MPTKTKKTKTEVKEREYMIPLRIEWRKVPRYKRAAKAIKAIKEFLVKHMRIYDRDLNKVKIDRYLNEFVWFRGIKKPPAKIKVKARMDGENVKVELVDYPEKLRFKKVRDDKRRKESEAAKEKKKTFMQKAKEGIQAKPEEKAEEKTEEEIKEEKEKKSAVVEEGEKLEKAKAKEMKHSAGGKTKEPKRQKRVALQK